MMILSSAESQKEPTRLQPPITRPPPMLRRLLLLMLRRLQVPHRSPGRLSCRVRRSALRWRWRVSRRLIIFQDYLFLASVYNSTLVPMVKQHKHMVGGSAAAASSETKSLSASAAPAKAIAPQFDNAPVSISAPIYRFNPIAPVTQNYAAIQAGSTQEVVWQIRRARCSTSPARSRSTCARSLTKAPVVTLGVSRPRTRRSKKIALVTPQGLDLLGPSGFEYQRVDEGGSPNSDQITRSTCSEREDRLSDKSNVQAVLNPMPGGAPRQNDRDDQLHRDEGRGRGPDWHAFRRGSTARASRRSSRRSISANLKRPSSRQTRTFRTRRSSSSRSHSQRRRVSGPPRALRTPLLARRRWSTARLPARP